MTNSIANVSREQGAIARQMTSADVDPINTITVRTVVSDLRTPRRTSALCRGYRLSE
jgi:hypothetical protein